jgi:hypothetical protein
LKIDVYRGAKEPPLSIIDFVASLVNIPLIKGATAANQQSRKAKAEESEKGGSFGCRSSVRSDAPVQEINGKEWALVRNQQLVSSNSSW